MNLPLDRLYRKTGAGNAALATRSAALPARARTALILVNGREPLAGLAHKIGAEAPALVAWLIAQGLIEEVPPPAAPARPKPAPPPERHQSQTYRSSISISCLRHNSRNSS